MKFVIYNRVSSEGQRENTSLDTQSEQNHGRVAELGGEVVGEFNEVMSGSLYFARTQLQSAIEMIERREASALVMLDMERFARHAAFQEIAFARIARAGGAVFFVREHHEDNEEGRLVRTIRGAVAQYYREKQRVLSMQGSANLAAQGIAPIRGSAPFAYYITQKADVLTGRAGAAGKYEIVPHLAPIARLIFEMRAGGATLDAITAALLAQKAPSGFNKPWQSGTVYSILGNSVYRGFARYGRQQIVIDEGRLREGKSHIRRQIRPESEWILIPAPAIVSDDLWLKAQVKR